MKTLRYLLINLLIALVFCFAYIIIDPTSIIQETFTIHIPRYIIYIIWTAITIGYLYTLIIRLPDDEPTAKKVTTQTVQPTSAVVTESNPLSEVDQLKKENQELKKQLNQLKQPTPDSVQEATFDLIYKHKPILEQKSSIKRANDQINKLHFIKAKKLTNYLKDKLSKLGYDTNEPSRYPVTTIIAKKNGKRYKIINELNSRQGNTSIIDSHISSLSTLKTFDELVILVNRCDKADIEYARTHGFILCDEDIVHNIIYAAFKKESVI